MQQRRAHDPDQKWLQGKDPDDLKKQQAYAKKLSYAGIGFFVVAVVFLCLAVYEVLGLGTTVDDALPSYSSLSHEEEKEQRQEIHAKQHALHEQGKSFHVDCVTHLSTHKLGDLAHGDHANIICPRGCAKHAFISQVDAVVWGSGTYTPDSFVCMAALHGTGKDGGHFRVSVVPGQSEYKGSTQHEIKSGSESYSHGKSFKIQPLPDDGIKVRTAGLIEEN